MLAAGVIAAVLAAQTPPNIPTLEGRWRLDETSGTLAPDSSGKGRNGTLTAGAAISAAGDVAPIPTTNVRSVVIANATANQRVNVPHNPGLAPTGAFTLACWVKPTGTPDTQMGLIEKWTGGGPAINGYLLRLGKVGNPATGHHVKVNVGNGTSQIEVAQYGQALPTDGTWTHVAATYDGTTLRLYRNGQPVGTPSAAAVTTSSDPLHLGQDYGNNRLQGNIDEAYVFSEALTQGQIGVLVNGQPAPTGLQVTPMPDHLVVSWNPAPHALVYHIYRADGAAQIEFLTTVTGTQYTDTTATFPGTYSYQIVAESYMPSAPLGPVSGTPFSITPRTKDHEEGFLDGGNCACGSSIPGASTPLAALLVLLGAAALRRRR